MNWLLLRVQQAHIRSETYASLVRLEGFLQLGQTNAQHVTKATTPQIKTLYVLHVQLKRTGMGYWMIHAKTAVKAKFQKLEQLSVVRAQ